MYAWADPDAVANGFSGPSNATGSRVARFNNYPTPIGGPPECRWSINTCGPNDEPFRFHNGGVNAVMGDGSVRFIRDGVFVAAEANASVPAFKQVPARYRTASLENTVTLAPNGATVELK